MTRTETIAFHIPDMTCAHCEKTLRDALSKAFPGADITIDLASRKLAINADPGRVKQVIAAAGYTPDLIT